MDRFVQEPARHLKESDFQIESHLGAGAAGDVYLGYEKFGEKRKVAIKVLTNLQAFDELTQTRFKAEVEVLRTFDHPNLVRAYDFFLYNGHPAYSMEYVEGEDLGRIISHSRLRQDQVEHVMLQLIEAIHELHSNNVIHRDLKLENVLLNKEGVVKLVDLGLMKKSDSVKRTKAGLILGTAQYMPPEYIKKGIFDTRGDIYALGMILLELLSGRRRLDSVPENKAMEHLIKSKFVIPDEMFRGVGEGFKAIICRATAANPAERYQNILEFRLDILSNRASLGVANPSQRQRLYTSEYVSRNLSNWEPRTRKRSYISKTLGAFSLSAFLILCMGYSRTLFDQSYVEPGIYRGKINLSGGKVAELELKVSAGRLGIVSKVLGCNGVPLKAIGDLHDCGGDKFHFGIEDRQGDEIKGYLIKHGTARIVEYDVKKIPEAYKKPK